MVADSDSALQNLVEAKTFKQKFAFSNKENAAKSMYMCSHIMFWLNVALRLQMGGGMRGDQCRAVKPKRE